MCDCHDDKPAPLPTERVLVVSPFRVEGLAPGDASKFFNCEPGEIVQLDETTKLRPEIEEKLLQQARLQRYAHRAVQDSLNRGEAPFAPHLFFTKWLDDHNQPARKRGLACSALYVEGSHRIAVYRDHGISEGMADDMEAATKFGVPIEFRSIGADMVESGDPISIASLTIDVGASK